MVNKEMSLGSQADPSAEQKSRNLKDQAKKLKSLPNRLFKRFYYPGMMHRMGVNLFSWEGINLDLRSEKAINDPNREKDNIDLLEEHLKEGKKLIVVFSHQGLGDVIVTPTVANVIAKRYPEYIKVVRYIHSKTIGSGKQGEDTKSSFDEAGKKQFRRNNMLELEVVSTNDVNIRHESSNKRNALKIMNALREDGSALALHNEATMLPGRSKNGNPEDINGMVHTNDDFRPLLERIIKEGIYTGPGKPRAEAVFLMVMIHGSYKIWSPDLIDPNAVPQKTRGITREAKGIILRTELAGLYGMPAPDYPLGKVRVSRPITSEELRGYEDPVLELELINARQAPPEARGVFKDLV